MYSMTGFGAASQERDACRVTVRLRSVNHRFLDLVLRMPEDLREWEASARREIAARLHRGRVEVRIEVDDRRDLPVEVHLNRDWIVALKGVAGDLAQEGLEMTDVGLGDLLRFPDALRIVPVAQEADRLKLETSRAALAEALEALRHSREQEGEKLGQALSRLLDGLSDLVERMEAAQEQVRAELEARLRQRLEELSDRTPELDDSRIGQELAMLVERSDVREELDRLASHLESFRQSMSRPGPIGKKLDFIAQEILRELSTLGAKCRQAGVVEMQVDAKLLCEQIREQVQNVE